MTTFARHEDAYEDRIVRFELRSVNHRYFDMHIKMPPWMLLFEDRIKRLVREHHPRGKIDLYIVYEGRHIRPLAFRPDIEGARSYINALYQLGKALDLETDFNIIDLLQCYSGLIAQEEAGTPIDEDSIWELLQKGLKGLLKSSSLQAQIEGKAIKEDFDARIETLKDIMDAIERRKKEVFPLQRERLKERLNALIREAKDTGLEIGEERIIQEYSIMADKLDISEELLRCRCHLDSFGGLINDDAPVGRKLDFLLQEMHREINTIASKAQDAEISYLVVEAKSEVEKLREQAQNVV